MIPICLVTGFLGAGKTTLLRRLAREHARKRLVYLVNEFSPHDIDGALVSKESNSVVAIPGGSIFCKCLVTEFISKLKSVPALFPGTEGVVIEASGMANPKVIQTMLEETGMDSIYRLARIVSVIDPNSFLKLRHTLPNIIAQVEASDLVLINKARSSSRTAVEEARAAVLDVNPSVEIAECEYAEHNFGLFDGRIRAGLQGEYAKCRDSSFKAETIQVEVEDLAGLERVLGKNVFRAKGSVMLGGERRGVEYSASGLCLAPELDDAAGLVVIMAGNR